MPRIVSRRLVDSLQSKVVSGFYTDSATLIQTTPTGSYDANNLPNVTTNSILIDCSFTDKPTREIWRDYADVEDIQAEIRFEGHTPTKGNHIRLTGQFDTSDFPDKTFEIVGIQNRDAFGWVCALKAVAI